MNYNAPLIINSNWLSIQDINLTPRNDDKQIYITCDKTLPNCEIPDNIIKVFLMTEPRSVMPRLREYLLLHYLKFDYIFTYDAEILKHCPNATFLPFGTSWMNEIHYENINTSNKQFKISTIIGSKSFALGHVLRTELYNNKAKIAIPNKFFISSREPTELIGKRLPKNSKNKLFNTFKYSLVIENSRQENYFTEKLIDCLITKTIPIYYGAPNISEYFDTSGWIILDTENVLECIDKINTLKDEYNEYELVVNSNWEKAHAYLNYEKRIETFLNGIP